MAEEDLPTVGFHLTAVRPVATEANDAPMATYRLFSFAV
jgi:hypothetical protein